jgi:hypothetical protein
LELFTHLKGINMNKLIATFIVGAFSAAAFAVTPATPASPATPAAATASAAKTDTKNMAQDKKAAAPKADAAKKPVMAPKADAAK